MHCHQKFNAFLFKKFFVEAGILKLYSFSKLLLGEQCNYTTANCYNFNDLLDASAAIDLV